VKAGGGGVDSAPAEPLALRIGWTLYANQRPEQADSDETTE
jgi:hypothetical protein